VAIRDIWIQIENHAWDVAPNDIDRMTGLRVRDMAGAVMPVVKTLTSPVTGATQQRTMFKPLAEDALILRRYTENWAAPDDRKINPWDLNEPDPTDTGTMGTIPGPVIECDLADRDTVRVYFRNADRRAGKGVRARTHSLHPHGFVFNQLYDGAYPLSAPDPGQPVGGQAALWAQVNVTGPKQGDRVPPPIDDEMATFTYTWETFGWPTTAGVWLYHDHSICDMDNVQLGAIGLIVIHNSADTNNEVLDPPLPGGSHTGSPIVRRCFHFPFDVPINRADLEGLGDPFRADPLPPRPPGPGPGPGPMPMSPEHGGMPPMAGGEHGEHELVVERAIRRGDLVFELDPELLHVHRLCLRFYRDPPEQARYLLLFHNVTGADMCINGRKWLGNTPTVVAGTNTRMRFGVVGMGNVDGFHTFHLHGHRWIIPGPDGDNPGAIQSSPQVTAVSQFEDTRTFGPANSFAFTIDQGSFMGSLFSPDPSRAPGLGEWHMHCHVLIHMMDGMMGSLLVVNGGSLALQLPRGVPCEEAPDEPTGHETVHVKDFAFLPHDVTVSAALGGEVTWVWDVATQHSTTSDTNIWDSGVLTGTGTTFSHTFAAPGTYPYYCVVHGGPGGVAMSGVVHVVA
jgi:plastocyanin/FtsP/CotA-like multicopper oxidase with cupredoxin domain